MLGFKLTSDLLWIHNNNNYIYMVLLNLYFPPSPINTYDRRWTMDNRAPLYNIISHDLWINFRRNSAKYLRIFNHCHVLQIHHVDRLAGLFSRTSCSSITGDHTNLQTRWLWTALSISWCTVSTRSAQWLSPAAIKNHHPKNFRTSTTKHQSRMAAGLI